MPFASETLRRINLGWHGNRVDRAVAEGYLLYGVARAAYDLHAAGDRKGVVDWYMGRRSSYTGQPITREVASRYANDIETFSSTGTEILWLSTCQGHLLWAVAEAGARMVEEYIEDNLNDVEDRVYYLLARPVPERWHRTTRAGHPITLWALH